MIVPTVIVQTPVRDRSRAKQRSGRQKGAYAHSSDYSRLSQRMRLPTIRSGRGPIFRESQAEHFKPKIT